jgi:glyoxylase-like metal-dependent hydrolase (beta-lactamase superfamily II)
LPINGQDERQREAKQALRPSWTVELLVAGGALQASITLARNGREAILVDTGYKRQEQLLLQQLDVRGLSPEAITRVANTHLHFDHAQNNHLFRNAAIHCSRKDFEWITGLCGPMINGSATLEDVFGYYPELRSHERDPRAIWTLIKAVQRFWKLERLGRNDQFCWLEDHPLPEGMCALHTPGHVPYHYSFVLDTCEGSTLIAGDAMIIRGVEDVDSTTFPPTDRIRYNTTKIALSGFSGTIIPGHDAPFAANGILSQLSV